jgi:hypothetical protein
MQHTASIMPADDQNQSSQLPALGGRSSHAQLRLAAGDNECLPMTALPGT